MASSLAEVDNERVIDESENELVGRVGDSGEAIDGTEMPRTGRKSCWSSSKHIRLLRAELSSHAPPAPGIGDAVVVFERRASVMARGNVAGNGGSGNSAGMRRRRRDIYRSLARKPLERQDKDCTRCWATAKIRAS